MGRFLPLSVVVVAIFTITSFSSPASAGIRQQMNQTIPEVPFSGVAFSDAVDYLRDISGANIVVNWKALEEAGIAKDAPINVRLRTITLRKALEMVISEAGGGDKLALDFDQNVVTITTRELADAKMFTRVYPIQDLIMEVPDFSDAPDFSLNTTSNNGSQNPGQAGGGNSASQSPFQGVQKEKPSKTRDERAADLIALIQAVIQPDVWLENGGKAAIRFWNGNLIVTAPRSVQEAIGGAWD